MGAVAGHMRHLYDDLDLTFGDIKEIFRRSTEGSLDFVEKVDGINMFFTVDGLGRVRFARNKGDISNSGALFREIQNRFSSHPAEKQIVEGALAVADRLAFSASPYFGVSGKNWVNAELVYAKKPVSIAYSRNAIVLHEMRAYDSLGKPLQLNLQDHFGGLCSAFSGTENDWDYYGPLPIQLLNRLGEGFYTDALESLKTFQGNIPDSRTLRDKLWIVARRELAGRLPIASWKQEALADRIAGRETSVRLVDIKRNEPASIAVRISELGRVTNRNAVLKVIFKPLSRAVARFSTSLLEGVHSNLVSNPLEQVDNLRERVENARALAYAIHDNHTSARQELIESAIDDLQHAGGVKSCIEGVVFMYKGNKYKFTGSYAAANQAIGVIRNGRGSIPAINEQMLEEAQARASALGPFISMG